GVEQTIFLSKMKSEAVLLAAAGLVAAGTGWTAYGLATPASALEAAAKPVGQAESLPVREAGFQSGPRNAAAKKSEAVDGAADTVELAGRVIDPEGKPVPGAKVHYLRHLDSYDDFGYGSQRATQTHQ